jgi:hypothetical protein
MTATTPFFRPHDYDNGDYAKKGKNGEETVIRFLMEHSDILSCDDLRDVRQMRWYDVDICIRTADGLNLLAEIKTDDYLGVSGNVLFETLRLNLTAPPERSVVLGWAPRSPARYLLYLAPKVSKLYSCRFDDLRTALQRYLLDAKQKGFTPETKYINTSLDVTTQNILIPMTYCADVFTIYDLPQVPVPPNKPEPEEMETQEDTMPVQQELPWNKVPERIEKFWNWTRNELALADWQTLEALGVSELAAFTGTDSEAKRLILDYVNQHIPSAEKAA